MKEKILITSALPYINNVPHMGHIAGSHLPADVFARFNRSYGNDVLFVGGSDEYGTASMISAKENNVSPKILVDKLSAIHKEIYDKLGISYDIFSGTSVELHKNVTQEFFKTIDDKGFIQVQEGKQLFCEKDNIFLPDRFVTGTCPKCGVAGANADQCEVCNAVYSPDELLNPKCSFCGGIPEMKDSKHIFFDLPKIENKLNDWIESKKGLWRNHVYTEAKRWINTGLKTRAISRDLNWGVPVNKEGFEKKVFYVWFDAPIGYISFVKQLGDDKLNNFWKNKDTKIFNFVGKDNIPFHTVFFPAMLLANENYEMPYNVVGLNFLNYEGQKISKSKKWGIFCHHLLKSNVDIDTIRAYLVTVIPETKDSDWKWDGFALNTNGELVGKFGNFFNRSLNMIWKNFDGSLDFDINESTEFSESQEQYIKDIEEGPKKIAELFKNCEEREAYKAIMAYASIGNGFIEREAPWVHIKNGNLEEVKKILYLCLNHAKSLTVLASPIIPTKCQEIWKQLNFDGLPTDNGKWFEVGKIDILKSHKINAPQPLFARVDNDILSALKSEFAEPFDMQSIF